MLTLGAKIKKQRLKKKLSQQDLATKAEISNSFLCDIEKDRANPSIPTLMKIADALEVKDINFFLIENYVNTDITSAI